MIAIESIKPLALIPSEDGIIGRFELVVRVDAPEPESPWDILEGLEFRAKDGDLAGGARLMSANIMSMEGSMTVIELVAAVLFDTSNKRFSLEVRVADDSDPARADGNGAPKASATCTFPKVMIYDFRSVTEHPVSNRYPVWFDEHRTSQADLEIQRETALPEQPTFSIVVPLYKTPLRFLEDVISSVQAQTYSHWELVLVNASPQDAELSEAVSARASQDPRIKVVTMEENEGIVGNTNAGIKAATGDFVGFMDHDDMIEPDLLFEYAKAIGEDPQIDLLYCDEDLFDVSGNYFDPLFKPDLNIDLLRTHNYVTHLYTIRKSVLDALELPGPEMEGAQDYDLTFKAIENGRHVHHVPKVLYHWRAHDLSTNVTPESKPYAQESGRMAIQRHLDRVYPGCEVKVGDIVNTYVVSYPIDGDPKVSVIIPNKDQPHYLRRCVESLRKHAGYENFEIVIVENGSAELATYDLYEELVVEDPRIRVLFWEGREFNYSALVNFGVEGSTGQYLLFLNNDAEAITDGFMASMLSYAMRPDVGVVGAKLLFADETIQHAGVSVQFCDPSREPAHHLFHGLPRGNGGYHDRAVKTQDYSAVTGACQMTSRAIFDELGGYDEALAVAFNDIDFCLKAREAGYLVVYDAQAELFHHESVSRGIDAADAGKAMRARKEHDLMFDRWAARYEDGDPYLNPNYDQASPYMRPVYSRSARMLPFALKRRGHRLLIKLQG